MKQLWGIVVGVLVGGAATFAFMSLRGQHARPEAGSAEHAGSGEQAAEAGLLKVDAETQRRIGLRVAAVQPATVEPVEKGYGKVYDPASLAALLSESASARAALDASTREVKRLRLLHGQEQNISTRVLEAAEATRRRDEIAYNAVQLRLLTEWGQPVLSRGDLSGLVRSLASRRAALVRIDLPLGVALQVKPTGARIAPLSDEAHPVEARYLGPVTRADSQTQGQGFLFLLKAPLPPGTAVVGWLQVGGERQSGVLLPRQAVLRYQGGAAVFRQTGKESFERTAVTLDRPLPDGWFVRAGLTAGTEVVVVAAQELLSEELKKTGGGGED
jgi:hypothetical protein